MTGNVTGSSRKIKTAYQRKTEPEKRIKRVKRIKKAARKKVSVIKKATETEAVKADKKTYHIFIL